MVSPARSNATGIVTSAQENQRRIPTSCFPPWTLLKIVRMHDLNPKRGLLAKINKSKAALVCGHSPVVVWLLQLTQAEQIGDLFRFVSLRGMAIVTYNHVLRISHILTSCVSTT